jgi:hypothetical protein
MRDVRAILVERDRLDLGHHRSRGGLGHQSIDRRRGRGTLLLPTDCLVRSPPAKTL